MQMIVVESSYPWLYQDACRWVIWPKMHLIEHRFMKMSLSDPRCLWLHIVAARCIKMNPDDCSWGQLPMVVSICMQMSLFDPRCPWLHIVAARCIQMYSDDCSWVQLPMVVSRCIQMSLFDPRCPCLHIVAARCIQMIVVESSCPWFYQYACTWVYLTLDFLDWT